jgi:hypothetical protein
VLALVFTALFTVYLIIPEAIFRFVFGFFVPTRTFALTRTETAYRAVLITIIPFLLAWCMSWYVPGPRTWPFPVRENTVQQRRADYRTVSASFYSDAEFTKSEKEFWHAATRCSRRQARLVSWYFVLVVAEALISGELASSYPKLKNKYLKWLSDRFLSPYISQWHPLLTPYLLPDTVVQADILCVDDTLYQGEVSQHFLKGAELSGIILAKPRRFDRAAYLKAKEEGKKPEPKEYWRAIPSQNLYFFADKILNINLSYLTVSGKISDASAVQRFLAEEISPEGIGRLTVSVQKAKQDQSK